MPDAATLAAAQNIADIKKAAEAAFSTCAATTPQQGGA